MQQPDITVIIPVRNRAALVGRTLASVAAQTYRPLRLVLVDNASTDSTMQVLERFAFDNQTGDFAVTIVSESKAGAAAARNRGLQEVTGGWVMFFDSDDVMAPTLVQAYAKRIDTCPEADLIACRVRLYGNDGASRELPFHARDLLANQLIHSVLATQRYIARRSLLPLWDETLMQWNDYEYAVRLLLTAPRVEFMAEPPMVSIMFTDDSITGSDFSSRHGSWERSLVAVERDILAANHPQRPRLLALVNYRRAVLAAHYRHESRHDLARPLLQQAQANCRNCWQRAVNATAYALYSHGISGFGHLARHLL